MKKLSSRNNSVLGGFFKISLGLILAFGLFGCPNATVPDLVGVTLTTAQNTLSALKLSVGNITYEFSATVPENQVIAQDPAPGTRVSWFSIINLVVSKGPEGTEGEGEGAAEGEGEGEDESEGESECPVYSDLRYKRNLGGLEFVVPAKATAGEYFPVYLDPGTETITRITFLVSDGAWSPFWPADYVAEDLGVSVFGMTLTYDHIQSVNHYHRWTLYHSVDNPAPSGILEFDASVAREGRVVLWVEFDRNGIDEVARFPIDIF